MARLAWCGRTCVAGCQVSALRWLGSQAICCRCFLWIAFSLGQVTKKLISPGHWRYLVKTLHCTHKKSRKATLQDQSWACFVVRPISKRRSSAGAEEFCSTGPTLGSAAICPFSARSFKHAPLSRGHLWFYVSFQGVARSFEQSGLSKGSEG